MERVMRNGFWRYLEVILPAVSVCQSIHHCHAKMKWNAIKLYFFVIIEKELLTISSPNELSFIKMLEANNYIYFLSCLQLSYKIIYQTGKFIKSTYKFLSQKWCNKCIATINIDYFIESATYGFQLFTSCKTLENEQVGAANEWVFQSFAASE